MVDTDIPSPGIHGLLGLEPEQTHATLNNYLWGERPIEDVTYNVRASLGKEESGQFQWNLCEQYLS